jgi:hypothetical protein
VSSIYASGCDRDLMIIVLLGYLGLRGSRCGIPGTQQTASAVQGGNEKMESVIQNELKLELEPIST